MPGLVLASRSPRRSELLRAAGRHFSVVPDPDPEDPWEPGESPVAWTRRLALAKATRVAARVTDALVLGADTTVWFDERGPPLGKPRDRADARAMIERLTAGREHRVTTGWALIDPRTPDAPFVRDETTVVWMRRLGPAQIEAYLETEEWSDKAGAYAVQGAAAGLVIRVEGSWTNVVGLPLAQVVERLEEIGS